MSCPSGIYAVNTTATSVEANGTVPVTGIVRRYGNAVSLYNNGVQIRTQGYYRVAANATVKPSAIGTVTMTLLKDGIAVPGAYIAGKATAATDAVPLSLNAMVRMGCCTDPASLTLQVSAASSVENVGMVVTKL